MRSRLDLADRGSDNAKDAGPAVRYDSMMTSNPLNDTIDATLQEFRTQQEGILHRLRDALMAAALEERRTAVSEARAVADAVAAERLEEALAKAKVQFSGDAPALQQLDALAAELGLKS